MNKKDLDILLEKYYRGETTLDEEQQLRESLMGDDADALLMQGLKQMESEVEVPDDLEDNLSNMIDQWQDEEQQEAKVAAPSMWRRSSWMAAAASVAIIATVGWWMIRNYSTPTVTGNSQPRIAKTTKIDVKPVQNEVEHKVEPVEPAQTVAEPQAQQPMHINKPSATLKPEAELLAQASEKPSAKSTRKSTLENIKADAKPSIKARAKSGAEPEKQNLEEELTPEDELLAMEALEKFSTTLNKGMEQLNDAGEKIDNINKTINQYIL